MTICFTWCFFSYQNDISQVNGSLALLIEGLMWHNKGGYCTYALNPACAFPRITVTFDSPQRGSLVFTVGADEDGNKNNSLLWSSVSHGVRTERLKNIENLCQACKVKMLKKSFPKTWPHVTRWQDVGQLTRLLLPESPPRQLRISWMISTISMWGYLLRWFLGCHRSSMWLDFTLRLRHIVEIKLTFTIPVNPWRTAHNLTKLVSRVLDTSFTFLYL